MRRSGSAEKGSETENRQPRPSWENRGETGHNADGFAGHGTRREDAVAAGEDLRLGITRGPVGGCTPHGVS